MRRRDFVQKAGAGVIGVSMLPPLADPFGLFQKNDYDVWLRQMSAATGMRWSGLVGTTPSMLITASENVNAKFAAAGYHHASSGFYFYPGRERICLFALEMTHPASVLSDVLLPVMREEADGTWTHVTTINGFELEALARASKALEQCQQPLDRLLLPMDKRHEGRRSGVLKSQDAEIEIITVLTKEFGASTRILISTSSRVVFDETFISGHCLTCGVL